MVRDQHCAQEEAGLRGESLHRRDGGECVCCSVSVIAHTHSPHVQQRTHTHSLTCTLFLTLRFDRILDEITRQDAPRHFARCHSSLASTLETDEFPDVPTPERNRQGVDIRFRALVLRAVASEGGPGMYTYTLYEQ